MAATTVTQPAIIKGSEALIPTVTAAIAGPKINPKLNAALTNPNAFARSSGLVESEITANATGMFPAVIPSSMRAKKRKRTFGANAIIKKEPAVPIIETRRRGRRPYLSESRPIIGVEMN